MESSLTESKGPDSVVRSDIWFQDGSVVLQAESTQFRVHKFVLAMHSTVFSDLFNSGLSSDGDTVEGCPIVILYDAADDVAHLLRTLYTPSEHFDTGVRLALDTVSSVLRLCKKYNVEHFYRKAVACIIAEYPMTVSGWDQNTHWTALQSYPGIDVDVIRLAREANILCVLPQAYQSACWSRLANDPSSQESPCTPFNAMSVEDQLLCVDGWAKTCAESTKLLCQWIDNLEGFGECTQRSKCRGSALESFYNMTGSQPFDAIMDAWSDTWLIGLCSSCGPSFRKSYEAWREDIWKRLPSFYGLPPWEELTAKSDLGEVV